ncbi:unnamed protein product, partial [Amoebophrya sp. A25]|eukprot:GSA25T00010357001.1
MIEHILCTYWRQLFSFQSLLFYTSTLCVFCKLINRRTPFPRRMESI